MTYEVTNSKSEINFAPSTELEEIIQNVRTILTTIQGSVPLYREFGISAETLDKPLQIAQAQITAELARQIANFEPRCNLKKVFVEGDLSGELKITATIEI